MTLYKILVEKVSISHEKKIKQKDYLPTGKLPVIDQGQSLIGGYTDNPEAELSCNLPVIVFGDHTRAVKYVDFPFGAGADGIKVLEPKPGIFPKYLYYATQYLVLRLEDRGYARHYQYIEKKELAIPPLFRQERTVARIEELFSKLDNGVETLRKTKQQLAVYRQAVLKDAFSGKLTVSQLLGYSKLSAFIEKLRYGTSKKCGYDHDETSVAVYRIPNIEHISGTIDSDDLKYANFADGELINLSLENGDLLIIRSNGSASLVGRAALVAEADTKGTFAGYLMRLRIKEKEELLPKFLLFYLGSHSARVYIENKAKSTSGVHNINSSEISNLEIPVFDKAEQERIIQAIDERISVCDSIEKTVDTALQQAEAMRQSILKQAFEGRLV